jgi:hypothetical protein
MSGPVHSWFGLSYSSYLVLPRALLEGMPETFQERLVALLEDMRELYGMDDQPDYWVRAKRGNRFVPDPYSNYRRPPPLPYRARPETEAPK